MNAASMSYGEGAGPADGDHGRVQETLRHHRHRRPMSTPVLGDTALAFTPYGAILKVPAGQAGL
jgi:hypothetical protein